MQWSNAVQHNTMQFNTIREREREWEIDGENREGRECEIDEGVFGKMPFPLHTFPFKLSCERVPKIGREK